MFAPGKFQAAAWTGLIGLLLLSTSGCSDSNDPGGGDDLGGQQIGPQGGTVRSADGQLTLTFPAGAVTQTQTITIEPLTASELGSEFSAFPVERAYQLGPEGLAFQQPVTVSVPSDQQVEQPDGSLRAATGLLLTSANGTALALEGLRLEEIDGGIALRGELSHFSPLVGTERFITVQVDGVPEQMAVNGTFTARVELQGQDIRLASANYSDASQAPIEVRPPGKRGEGIPIPENAPNNFVAFFPYTCTAQGEGLYYAGISATALEEEDHIGKLVDVSILHRRIRCTEAVEPTLTVTKTGSGTGTVTSNPAGINAPPAVLCPGGTQGECEERYPSATSVSLTASPNPADFSVFITWSGACPGGSAVTTVVMDGDKTCTAEFQSLLEELGSIDLGRDITAVAQIPVLPPGIQSRLLVLGRGAGVIDYSNPAQLRLEPGGIDPFCPNVNEAFFIDPRLFIGLRTTPSSLCFGEVPLTPPEILPVDAPPTAGTAIPGTTAFGIGFDIGTASLVEILDFGDPAAPPADIQLPGDCLSDMAASTTTLYVTLGCNPPGLALIDIGTKQVTTHQTPAGVIPAEIALALDGSVVWITDVSPGGGFIWRFDPTLGTFTRLSPSFGPDFSAVALEGGLLAVANGTSNTLHVLDGNSGTVIGDVPSGGNGAFDIQRDPLGRIFVVHSDGNVSFFEEAFR